MVVLSRVVVQLSFLFPLIGKINMEWRQVVGNAEDIGVSGKPATMATLLGRFLDAE
jgi:hypothetical protein